MKLFEADLRSNGLPPMFRLRPLESDDFFKGFPELLAELTDIGSLNEEKFKSILP